MSAMPPLGSLPLGSVTLSADLRQLLQRLRSVAERSRDARLKLTCRLYGAALANFISNTRFQFNNDQTPTSTYKVVEIGPNLPIFYVYYTVLSNVIIIECIDPGPWDDDPSRYRASLSVKTSIFDDCLAGLLPITALCGWIDAEDSLPTLDLILQSVPVSDRLIALQLLSHLEDFAMLEALLRPGFSSSANPLPLTVVDGSHRCFAFPRRLEPAATAPSISYADYVGFHAVSLAAAGAATNGTLLAAEAALSQSNRVVNFDMLREPDLIYVEATNASDSCIVFSAGAHKSFSGSSASDTSHCFGYDTFVAAGVDTVSEALDRLIALLSAVSPIVVDVKSNATTLAAPNVFDTVILFAEIASAPHAFSYGSNLANGWGGLGAAKSLQTYFERSIGLSVIRLAEQPVRATSSTESDQTMTCAELEHGLTFATGIGKTTAMHTLLSSWLSVNGTKAPTHPGPLDAWIAKFSAISLVEAPRQNFPCTHASATTTAPIMQLDRLGSLTLVIDSDEGFIGDPNAHECAYSSAIPTALADLPWGGRQSIDSARLGLFIGLVA